MQKYRRCFWVHKYLLSTYQIWLFHTHSSFICSAEAYVLQCHDISLSVDYIAKHKPISSLLNTKVNSKFSGFLLLLWYGILWSYLNPPPHHHHHHFIKGVRVGGECFQRRFSKLLQNVGGSDFFHKKQEVCKIGGLF